MKEEKKTIAAILEGRNKSYHFYAGFYMRECSEDYLRTSSSAFNGDQAAEGFCVFDADLMASGIDASGSSVLDEGWITITTYLQKQSDDKRSELARDYAKVFLGAGIYDGESASPYESVYTSSERILMQEARDEVYALFCAEGLRPMSGFEDASFPEDHLSFELEYMAYCGERMLELFVANDLESCKKYLALQLDFIENHLLNWVPSFCNDAQRLCRTDFYRGIVGATEGFVVEDKNFLVEFGEWVSENKVH